jgi:hypothetical protein
MGNDTLTQTQITQVPEYISDRQQQVLNTLYGVKQVGQPGDSDYVAPKQGLLQLPQNIPQQLTAGLSPAQLQAMQMQQAGIGAYQPFLDAATKTQAGAIDTVGRGVESLGQMQFDPARAQAFMDPYQQSVTQEALKEIDRQAAMAGNQLAGKAVQAGAFGGSRFGLQQSELARSAQDLRSRRIFEDLSRNYQQAQQASAAANQQRLQQGAAFGQLGSLTSGIGGQMAGLGGQAQGMGMQDVSSTLGIGGLQQQQLQRQADVGYQNQLNQMMEPYRRLSFGTQSLQQLTPGAGTTQQTISPVPQGNPYLQAAGAIGSIGTGLGALIGN